MVIAWMLLIFYFSAQYATDSSSMSNGVIVWLKQFLPLDFINMESIQTLVRKSAHFLEYACLGFLSYRMFSQTTIFMYAGRSAAVLSFLYASSDELHQAFVPGRACMWQDVLLDTSGAIFGIFFAMCIYRIVYRYRHRS